MFEVFYLQLNLLFGLLTIEFIYETETIHYCLKQFDDSKEITKKPDFFLHLISKFLTYLFQVKEIDKFWMSP